MIDQRRLRDAHAEFLQAHARMVDEALLDSGDVVKSWVYLSPGFKPVTGKSQAATATRLMRTSGGKLLRVTNRSKNAARLERGTQPHFIFARRKKNLRFIGRDGRWVSKGAVKHPGTKPYWFVRNATERAGNNLRVLLEAGMRRISSRKY